MADTQLDLDLSRYKLGWSDVEEYVFRPEKGLNEAVVRDISWWKGEPDWMTKFRMKSKRARQWNRLCFFYRQTRAKPVVVVVLNRRNEGESIGAADAQRRRCETLADCAPMDRRLARRNLRTGLITAVIALLMFALTFVAALEYVR